MKINKKRRDGSLLSAMDFNNNSDAIKGKTPIVINT